MKTLVFGLAAAAIVACPAMTHEEAVDFFARKNVEKDMTAENLQTWLDAAVATTNGWYVRHAWDKKLLSVEDATAWFAKVGGGPQPELSFAIASSNKAVRVAFTSKIAAAVAAEEKPRKLTTLGWCFANIRRAATDEDEALDVAKAAIGTGKLGWCGQAVYAHLPKYQRDMATGKVGSIVYTSKYYSFAKENFAAVARAWVEVPVVEDDTFWANGGDIAYQLDSNKYFADDTVLDAVIEKYKKILAAGVDP